MGATASSPGHRSSAQAALAAAARAALCAGGQDRATMAAGLTDRVWSLREVLLFRVPPWPQPAGVGASRWWEAVRGGGLSGCRVSARPASRPSPGGRGRLGGHESPLIYAFLSLRWVGE